MDINTKVKLNDGNEIPVLGLGTYLANPGDEVLNAVETALNAGYRHIDTAAMYGNEFDIGTAVRLSGRRELRRVSVEKILLACVAQHFHCGLVTVNKLVVGYDEDCITRTFKKLTVAVSLHSVSCVEGKENVRATL